MDSDAESQKKSINIKYTRSRCVCRTLTESACAVGDTCTPLKLDRKGAVAAGVLGQFLMKYLSSMDPIEFDPPTAPIFRLKKAAPKKNWTAYQFYVEENRQALKEQYPGVGFGQISKIAAAQWKSLSEEDKNPYYVMARNDKLRYEEMMQSYSGSRTPELPTIKKAKRAKNTPKAPLTAYFAFTKVHRHTVEAEHPDLSVTDVTKEIAHRWRNLPLEERGPYEEMSRLDKLRYKDEMAIYKAGII